MKQFSSDKQALDFDEINDIINSPTYKVDICELEGYFLGLIAIDKAQNLNLNNMLENLAIPLDDFSSSQKQITSEMFDFYQNYDWRNDFCPDFLFTQITDFKNKLLALKQFSAGFLFALGVYPDEFKNLTKINREFVNHLIDFSQLSTEELQCDELEQESFEEIVEFIKAGVSVMIADNKISETKVIH